jgi:hypothetical protein
MFFIQREHEILVRGTTTSDAAKLAFDKLRFWSLTNYLAKEGIIAGKERNEAERFDDDRNKIVYRLVYNTYVAIDRDEFRQIKITNGGATQAFKRDLRLVGLMRSELKEVLKRSSVRERERDWKR